MPEARGRLIIYFLLLNPAFLSLLHGEVDYVRGEACVCREPGVRALRKHLEKIYRKLAMKMVQKADASVESEEAPSSNSETSTGVEDAASIEAALEAGPSTESDNVGEAEVSRGPGENEEVQKADASQTDPLSESEETGAYRRPWEEDANSSEDDELAKSEDDLAAAAGELLRIVKDGS